MGAGKLSHIFRYIIGILDLTSLSISNNHTQYRGSVKIKIASGFSSFKSFLSLKGSPYPVHG